MSIRRPIARGYVEPDSASLDVVWERLMAVVPTIQRQTKSGRWEAVEEVRMVLRRRSGQWLVSVGDISRTGTTEAEALLAVVEAYEDISRKRRTA